MQTANDSRYFTDETDRLSRLTIAFTHPEDVLQSRVLGDAEKRAILADWASDAHAVPDQPAMRQLDSGAIVSIDAVLAALRSLDTPAEASTKPTRRFPVMRRAAVLPSWRRPLRRFDGDDDDQPPPSPAAALPPGVELERRRRRERVWDLAAA